MRQSAAGMSRPIETASYIAIVTSFESLKLRAFYPRLVSSRPQAVRDHRPLFCHQNRSALSIFSGHVAASQMPM
jgi:hypothetical protein